MDYITLGQAFAHVSHSFSYWMWIVLSLVPITWYLIGVFKFKVEQADLKIVFFLVALVLAAVFVRPCEIAANTTVEQAERGVYIGY